jgi:hypothetical protein
MATFYPGEDAGGNKSPTLKQGWRSATHSPELRQSFIGGALPSMKKVAGPRVAATATDANPIVILIVRSFDGVPVDPPESGGRAASPFQAETCDRDDAGAVDSGQSPTT